MKKVHLEVSPEQRRDIGPSTEDLKRLRNIHTHAVEARQEAEALTEVLSAIEKELADPSQLSTERLDFLFKRWEELSDQRENLTKDSKYLTEQLRTFLDGGGVFPS
jgi:DNA repair exonuclease SbcCD ATPase subunit